MDAERSSPGGEPPALATLRELVGRARQGDPAALPLIRDVLEENPRIWIHLGDIAAHAERAWIELIAGDDPALGESLARRAEALKAELCGPDPTPLERLLAERVAACYLQLGYADASYARSQGCSLRQLEHAARRQDRAHRRFLTAVGALATAQRLLPASMPEGRGSIPADTPGPLRAALEAPQRSSDNPTESGGASSHPIEPIPGFPRIYPAAESPVQDGKSSRRYGNDEKSPGANSA
ncbi:hypothetical protein [Tautonia plasticadhaerens]|uniref:Uncharacterized protein n=1 Tax=Tautonia plasticadhaerens TaxID=2527974 RepID=A0A518H9E6_9BACT|nr:hypothetical protein [Tautonia plasticadhaerens]QDV37427.1 hypothetical protein ElP_53660 [Tautonia plasticadhaerens]